MGLFTSKLTTRELVPLCRQLATSYDAGIPVLQGLALSARNSSSRKVRDMLNRMIDRIRNGSTLAGAARAEEKYLPPFFTELLAAGEKGGRLDEMLRDLAEYYEDQQTLKRTVLVAMTYPAIQLLAAWFLGTFALRTLKHQGTGDFQFDVFLREYFIFQARAVSIALLAFIGLVGLSQAGVLQWITGFIKSYIPPFRGISRRFALARFFRSMCLLVGAGLDIRDCIKQSARLTMNPIMERDLLQSIPIVSNGGTLVEAFSKVRCLSSVGREMLAVGEQSGNLEFSLRKVSEYHLEEARAAVRIGLTIMGILVLLLVGGIIGYIVISFYSGLYAPLNDIDKL